MLVTEKEAKDKWCPFARVFEQGSSVPAMNRIQKAKDTELHTPFGARCIGSFCMAWREAGTQMRTDSKVGNYEADVGYCGLADNPRARPS